MAEKTAKKQADQPWLERNERQRMFAHLSLDVFEKHTNIRDLIGDEYTAKNEKIPSLLHLNLKAKDYFEQVKSPEGWSAAIFDNLDFVIPEDQQNDLSAIWGYSKKTRDKIYAYASEGQKRVIYLPCYTFANATNAREVAAEHAKDMKFYTTPHMIDEMIQKMHSMLQKVKGWLPVMNKLHFITSTGNECNEAEGQDDETSDSDKSFVTVIQRPASDVEFVPNSSIIEIQDSTDQVEEILESPEVPESKKIKVCICEVEARLRRH